MSYLYAKTFLVSVVLLSFNFEVKSGKKITSEIKARKKGGKSTKRVCPREVELGSADSLSLHFTRAVHALDDYHTKNRNMDRTET